MNVPSLFSNEDAASAVELPCNNNSNVFTNVNINSSTSVFTQASATTTTNTNTNTNTVFNPNSNINRTQQQNHLTSPIHVSKKQKLETQALQVSTGSFRKDSCEEYENPFADGRSNILVSVRVRPESAQEKMTRFAGKNPSRHVVRVVDKNMLVFDPTDDEEFRNMGAHKRRTLGLRRGKDLQFVFDRVFNSNATQLDIYDGTIKYLLESVLDGYNATVFAYGATGAGKTYTMLGSDHSGPGVMVLTMIDLFSLMEKNKHEKQYKVTVSYLEVYNETIRDLLADKMITDEKQQGGGLELREDKEKGMMVAGLSEHCPKNADEVLELLNRGNNNRAQSGTAANAQSSRSHAVFQVFIEQRNRTADTHAEVRTAKLSLIDLAGSERAAVTKNRGVRLVEGANINKSLLALANCINALGKKNSKYVPYRNSKLTRLLKDSLGGNCRTIMIANVSPSSLSYEDTYNTLRYANRAKNIKTTAKKNVLNVNMHVSKYKKIIEELVLEVGELKRRLAKAQDKAEKEAQFARSKQDLEHEKQDMESMLQNLKSLFTEEVQTRKDILAVEESDRQNALEVLKYKNEIKRWECDNPDCDSPPVRIITAKKDMKSLISASQDHANKRSKLENNLNQKVKRAKSICDSIPMKIKNVDLRRIADQESRIHELEISNIDLERLVQHHRARENRLSMLLDESTFALSKVKPVLVTMFNALINCKSLTSDMEKSYQSVVSLLETAENAENNESYQIEDEEWDLSVEEAFRTPKGILSLPTNSKQSLSFERSPNSSDCMQDDDDDEDEGVDEQNITANSTEGFHGENKKLFTFVQPPISHSNSAPTLKRPLSSRDSPVKKVDVQLFKSRSGSQSERLRPLSANSAIAGTVHMQSAKRVTSDLQEKFSKLSSEWNSHNDVAKRSKVRSIRKRAKLESWGSAFNVMKSPRKEVSRETPKSERNIAVITTSLVASSSHSHSSSSSHITSTNSGEKQNTKKVKFADTLAVSSGVQQNAKIPNYMSATASSKNRGAPSMFGNNLLGYTDQTNVQKSSQDSLESGIRMSSKDKENALSKKLAMYKKSQKASSKSSTPSFPMQPIKDHQRVVSSR